MKQESAPKRNAAEDLTSYELMQRDAMLASVHDYIYPFANKEKDREITMEILEAMRFVDRRFFVENPSVAFIDNAIPIGEGQTISQPSTVARVLMLAKLTKGLSILEVGSGSGWNACLIAYLVHPGVVVSIEKIQSLSAKARKNLQSFKEAIRSSSEGEVDKFALIEFRNADFFKLAGNTYDRIIMTAGIGQEEDDIIKSIALKLLNEKGIMVCPYQSGPLIILKKRNGAISKEYTSEQYSFVPLVHD